MQRSQSWLARGIEDEGDDVPAAGRAEEGGRGPHHRGRHGARPWSDRSLRYDLGFPVGLKAAELGQEELSTASSFLEQRHTENQSCAGSAPNEAEWTISSREILPTLTDLSICLGKAWHIRLPRPSLVSFHRELLVRLVATIDMSQHLKGKLVTRLNDEEDDRLSHSVVRRVIWILRPRDV